MEYTFHVAHNLYISDIIHMHCILHIAYCIFALYLLSVQSNVYTVCAIGVVVIECVRVRNARVVPVHCLW